MDKITFANILTTLGEEGDTTFLVLGKVSSPHSAAVGGLDVRIVDKRVGDDFELATTITDDDGAYQATFDDAMLQEAGKEQPDLQAHVSTVETLLGSSEVRYNASRREFLSVQLDEQATPVLLSEHEVVTGALANHHEGRPGDLREDDERRDITYLANKTGWDARAVATCALADQLSVQTTDERGLAALEPAYFYALLRAGLPADPAALYRIDSESVKATWQQAIDNSVIPGALQSDLTSALERFQDLAAGQMLGDSVLTGVSTTREMLTLSLGEDETLHQQFASLHARHQADPATLWSAVREELGAAAQQRLRLDGQLAFLTLNNAPLIGQLHAAAGEGGLEGPRGLATTDFHRPEKWLEVLGDGPVPPEITGENDVERRLRYAERLAASVRLSYPTTVLARRVESGSTPVAEGLAGPVHDFLIEHQEEFEIGARPVEQFIISQGLEVAPEVSREITRLQRVHQITPHDGAMDALLTRGMDSALAIVRQGRDAFVNSVQDDVGGEAEARRIHARAEQVHNATLNIALAYLNAASAPAIGVHSPAQIVDPAPTGPGPVSDVIAYETLEGLFGNMDACACAHCRSILSPAAYLVDLLLFIDRPQVPEGMTNPLTVLLERRPDLQHLPLTCENTNTPLPYIDVVNETLEYYVWESLDASNPKPSMSLHGFHGHTTDDSVNPAELAASPGQILDEAYPPLAEAHFPPPLPFHRPLESLRRVFDKLGAPLPSVMRALREGDEMERSGPAAYGWRDILMEELRLSRNEYALLTDRSLTLQQLYGFSPSTPDGEVTAELSNVGAFTRRLSLPYDDLVEILRTRFINPSSTLLPRLERLGVSFATLEAFKDGVLTPQEFDDALAPGLDSAPYGGDIKAWVLNEDNYADIMGLITLSSPNGDPCDLDQLELRYAHPDPSANTLRAFEFVRLIRFVRLWKKLGWSIERTDQAITALYPSDLAPGDPDDTVNLELLDGGFLTLLPRLGVVRRVMMELGLKPERDLASLLACWAPIDTHGEASLYRRMLLGPEHDEAFEDDGFGRVLTDGAIKLVDHSEALRAAFHLSGDEFAEISAALGHDASTALETETISAIFRRGWLARQLRLSVHEFLLLVRMAGIDPFAAPQPLASPEPAPAPILSFLELVEQLRAASLTPAQALYLIWNQDVSGRSTPVEGEVTSLAQALRVDLAAIDLTEGSEQARSGQQALQSLAAATGLDLALANLLLVDPAVLHAAGDSARPALDDLTALATPGLSASFFFASTASGTIAQTSPAEADMAYAAGSNPLPDNGGNPISGIWHGYAEAPEDGSYQLRVEAEAGATVQLSLAGAALALTQKGATWTTDEAVELRGGRLAAISLTVENIVGDMALRWRAAAGDWQVIPGNRLYPTAVTDNLRQVYVRFLKAATLADNLGLTASECAALAAHAELRIGGQSWLSRLPGSGDADGATSAALTSALRALLDFAHLKAAMPGEDGRLLSVLENPAAAAQAPTGTLFSISGWRPEDLDAWLSRFGLSAADLGNPGTLRRVHNAQGWVQRLGITATALILATTNEPDADIVRHLHSALRALYDEEHWLEILQPIHHEMRGLRRDALVTHILHALTSAPETAHIDTPEKLFEFFLMDVKMQPCMQTSRVRHALSSVQLFIERCLMNLETRVAPSSIDAPQWQWMSRYRVWEANRKVFLWPENWLEPELRDGASPFFKETMSELLQGDITEDAAATAMLGYLGKLEEVAKLEPCGIHYTEGDPEAQGAGDVAHVVARSAGASRKYFYRRREHGSWTPWEQIKLDIEDTPLTPVMWKGRLFLFWLRILQQPPLQAQTPGDPGQSLLALTTDDIQSDTKIRVQAVLCWSEYFNGQWQPAKTSDAQRPTAIKTCDSDPASPSSFDRSQLRLGFTEGTDILRIAIFGTSGASTFLLYNTHSLPVRKEDLGGNIQVEVSDSADHRWRSLGKTQDDTFYINYLNSGTTLTRDVLRLDLDCRTVEPMHVLQNTWQAPFFLEDSRHVFYVSTTEKLVKISDWEGFDVGKKPIDKIRRIPSLVLPPQPGPDNRSVPDLGMDGPIYRGPGFGASEPAAFERFVSEDAYIERGIGSPGIVRFGDLDIGPIGALTNTSKQF